ncbi:hypothetical protein FVR03_23865 [Pontibacter qinzhouensis]|uniref:Type I restriction modification DNA specificity domain-containing protein n=1 Tax=Pontibacter qinzhouensis TaxID=2603253 RepID=A0A5C8IGH7_9BACT|nr:restriction endonuclease subunit S [Pontibacter qinzhouensis]TXK20953.1 hypothetical protein FVR03_23865 [Pontibacter qinzhouensis]
MIDKSVLPEHWEVKKLGDVCEFEYGKALKKELRDETGKYDVFGSNGVVGKHAQYIIEEPCVIVGRKGAAGEVHLSLNPAWPIDTTYFVKQKPSFDLKFLYYQLRSLQLGSLDKSTAIPGLNRNDAYQKEFVLPPLTEQLEIVAKIEELFSELDKGKEQLITARQQLKVYRQAVLKWAFEGRFTNLEVKEEELPEGWKWVKTGEVIQTINNGYTPKKGFLSDGEGEVPFIKVYNLNFDGTLNSKKNPTFIPRAIHVKDLKRSICYPGDVLINIVGPPLGKVSVVSNEYPEWNINQAIVLFRPNEKVSSKYLSYFMQNSVTINWLEKTSKATAGQWNVKVTTCREIPLPLAPPEEQNHIVQEIESRLSVCDKVEETISLSLQQAETLRQSILKQAFEGKLVKQSSKELDIISI